MLVKIAADTLVKIRGELVKHAELEKRAARLEQANEIYRRTMNLVAEGSLDPEVAIVKVAEFQENPDRLEIFEAAMNAGVHETTKLGTVVEDGQETPAGAGSPEGKLSRRVEEIVDGNGLTRNL